MAKCTAHSKRHGGPCGGQATKLSRSRGQSLCYQHGGAPGSGGDGGDGRPIIHALYSRHVPADWLADYEYFKSDPDILSLQSDIAVARVARARFIKNCEGSALTAELADTILEHGIKIGKLIEVHSKVQFGEKYTITPDSHKQLMSDIGDVIATALDASGISSESREQIAQDIAAGLARIGAKE